MYILKLSAYASKQMMYDLTSVWNAVDNLSPCDIYNNIKRMNANTSAIQYMGMIMRLEQLNVDYVLSMVEIVNNSYLSAKDIVTIL